MRPGNFVDDIADGTPVPVPSGRPRHARSTIYVLCGLAGIIEGFDLQSGGMAAAHFAADLHMRPDQVGFLFLLTSLGLAIGAPIGGWIGDRAGPGRGMGIAIILFSCAAIGSAMAPEMRVLAIMRTFAGLGLGGTLPNMIALLTNTGPPASGPRRVTLSVTAMAGGNLIMGLATFIDKGIGWRTIFHLAGWVPLLVGIAACLILSDTKPEAGTRVDEVAPGGRWKELFGQSHRMVTALLWVAFFITSATSYLVINWMPTFLTQSGLDLRQVGVATIGLAIGGAAGPITLASLFKPGRISAIACVVYGGVALGLFAFISVPATTLCFALAITLISFFTSSASAMLFGIVGPYYSAAARGSGVGAAVALGRVGAGVGPALAGVMLNAGIKREWVVVAVMPMLVIALVAILALLARAPELLKQKPADCPTNRSERSTR